MESWVVELGKGIGKLFLNPLLYWSALLLFLLGYKRIKRERNDFGVKIFSYFNEIKGTWIPAVLFGLVFSIAILAAGIVFSPATLIVLSLAMIILSLLFRLTTLSASYTVGLTYLAILILPTLLENQQFMNNSWLEEINYIALTMLLGLMLLAEAYFTKNIDRKETQASLRLSDRGYWTGEHHLRKLSVIPVFLLVPEGLITPFAAYWPTLSVGDGTYGIILFPFLLGFSHSVRGSLSSQAGRYLAKGIMYLGILVIIVSVTGIFVPGMSLVAILIGVLGREFILYRFKLNDKNRAPYYQPHVKGAKVLAVIPGTPADRLEIQPGEIVARVNDKKVKNADEFYLALQTSGAYFKLDILDDREEVRFVQGAFYEGDHHKLGLIFIKEPYRKSKKVM